MGAVSAHAVQGAWKAGRKGGQGVVVKEKGRGVVGGVAVKEKGRAGGGGDGEGEGGRG